MIVVDQSIVDEIARIGRERAPAEACGVLLPSPLRGQWVWEMPNRSHTPHDSFELHGSDIELTLRDWFDAVPVEEVERVAVWHTHPKGNLGPSRFDMQNRLPGHNNLVISLGDDAKATWY